MTEVDRSPDAVLAVVRAFVRERRGELTEELTLDTRLIDDGIVDSFALVELGLEVSRALQVPLLSGNLLPEDFESARTLWSRIQELTE